MTNWASREGLRSLSLAFYIPWNKAWGGKSPHPFTALAAATVAVIVSVPLLYILFRAGTSDIALWERLWNTRIPKLLGNTLGLAAAVTAATSILALPLAWLVVRSDLPGRRVFKVLLGVPLAIPPYIGALTYIQLLGFNGLLKNLVPGLPTIYSFWGVALVLTLFTFPYTYLIAKASIENMNANLEEAAKACGRNNWQIFWEITMPMLRPAVGAGGLLVALYVLSDFGVITMLRYETFTSAIYTQLVGRYDRASAALLSTILVSITGIAMWLEWRSRSKAKYYQTLGTYRACQIVALGCWRYPALVLVAAVVVLSVVLPLVLLVTMTAKGLQQGAISPAFWQYTLNSFLASVAAAAAATAGALPIAYLSIRHGGYLGKGIARMAYAGYSLPGLVIALGVIFFFNQLLPILYGTVALLITAYVIRFLPQCLQAQEAAITQISPNLEEAAAVCGYSRWETLWRITFPLMRSGVMAGWALAFLSSMKELPATLILRPAGFDTLSVRIWVEASEGYYTLAAPAALLLVTISLVPLFLISQTKPQRGRS